MKHFVIFILLHVIFTHVSAQNSEYFTVGCDTSLVCRTTVQLHARPYTKTIWTNYVTGLSKQINSFDFLNDSIGVGVGSLGMILKTVDAGGSWSALNSGSTASFLAVKMIDKNKIVAITSSGLVYRSTDGGITWLQSGTGISSTIKNISIQSFDTIYATYNSAFYKTFDGGQTWSGYTFTGKLTTSVHFLSSTTGFVGLKGAIYKTTDGGNTWCKSIVYKGNTDISSTVSLSINYFSFVTPKKGFAVSSYNQLLTTNDGGRSWVVSGLYSANKPLVVSEEGIVSDSILSLSGAVFNYVRFVSPQVGYLRGYLSGGLTTGFILKTIDGGLTWKWIYVSAANKLIYGCFMNEYKGYVAVDANTVGIMTSENTPDKGLYRWEPSTGLSNQGVSDPFVTVTSPVTYFVTRTENLNSSMVTYNVFPTSLKVFTCPAKHLGCAGSVPLDTVYTNYNGEEDLHYKWTPSIGLNNDTLCNPIASPSATTTYTLTVSGPSGCTASNTITVFVDPLATKTMAAKTLIAGGSVIMDSVTTNYSGSGRLRYKWSPAIGLSSDTVASPVVSPKATTTYTVTVTAPTGCTASANVVVNVSPLTVDVTNNLNTSCGNPAQLGVLSTNYTGTAALKYKWTPSAGLDNDSIASPKATVTVATTYTLTITTANGATATDKVVVTPVGLNAPSISYVAIGNANKNVVNWNKSTDGTVSYYKLYKETNVTNSYSLVGTVSASAATTFTDTTSTPDVQSNKYKLSLVDACGIETSMSAYHKTMHLTINKGVGTVWNLIWEQYEGFSVATYYIYRGQTSGNISLIGSLSGSNTQFSDYTAPLGDVYYQIEAVSSALSAVRSSGRSLVNAGALVYTSRSNIATNSSGANGIDDLHNVSINLVPNPANNAVVVNFDAAVSERMQLQVFNSVGQAVMSVSSVSSGQKVQIGSLTEGIYTVVLKSGNYSGKQKLVVAK